MVPTTHEDGPSLIFCAMKSKIPVNFAPLFLWIGDENESSDIGRILLKNILLGPFMVNTSVACITPDA
jgi:hypothetical protein